MSAQTLQDDSFVMLDPAVEVLDVEIDEYRLLCHGYFEVGMAVPPGEGLLDFVTALAGAPIGVAALRERFDDQQMVGKMLSSLFQHGFLHGTTSATPSVEELADLRHRAALNRKKAVRRSIVVDLDVRRSIDDLCARLSTEEVAPEVRLGCRRLADHRHTLAALAGLHQAGRLRLYHTVLQTADLTCDREISRSLARVGVSVTLEGVPWPVPGTPIPGLADMTSSRVAVHVLMTPDLSILDGAVRERVTAWAASVFLSGLCLRLDVDALWPAGDGTDDEFSAVFDAVHLLEDEFGDVEIANLPSDEVLLGNTASSLCHSELSARADRFRMAYLRHRIPFLKSCELTNVFSQTPEAEERLVRSEEDLLPNQPGLLQIRSGSTVVDVCGGLGRVARRLAPAVGEDGLIISIEMLRCVSGRARNFACEKGITNIDFRPGLAQRLPLPDGTMDAAVNEWTAGIWQLGLGAPMVQEMARVVRPGGRIAVTHRLVRIPLTRLGHAWAQYEDIYEWMCDAFVHPDLTVLIRRIWGQIVPSLVGEHATSWRKQYLPRVINEFDMVYDAEDHVGPHADVFFTIVAERTWPGLPGR